MINLTFTPSGRVAILRPEGKSSKEDFANLDKAFNDYINEHDIIPNLVIHTDKFPEWEGLGAMREHMHFIKEHQSLIKKIAIVTDNSLLKGMDDLVNHFVGAKIRDFPESFYEKALEWAERQEDHPGKFEILGGLPNDVIAFSAHGTITAQDYRKILMPLVDEKLKRHDKLKVLFVTADDFIACSAGAVWDDFRFGMMHLGDFEKMAIVSDMDWIRHSVKLFAPFMGSKVRVFHLNEQEKACSWIKT